MNKQIANLTAFFSRFNRQHVQLVLVIVTLAMLVLGIGAPSHGVPVQPH